MYFFNTYPLVSVLGGCAQKQWPLYSRAAYTAMETKRVLWRKLIFSLVNLNLFYITKPLL